MEVPATWEALAAYARTAMEPVKSPATAAPVMTALDGFMVQFLFEIWFGFARLRKTRVTLEVVSSFPGQKFFEGQCKRGRHWRHVETRSGSYLLRLAVSLSLKFDKYLTLPKHPGSA
jgi:hypothetical protein